MSSNKIIKMSFHSVGQRRILLTAIMAMTIIIANFSLLFLIPQTKYGYAQTTTQENGPYVGVDFRGLYTAISQSKSQSSEMTKASFPHNYYEDSFRIISDAGMNHVRYTLYWEGYVVDPEAFINELRTVASTADKYGINVLYDNHQFHTSSYLNPQRGNGFPFFLFEGSSTSPAYSYGSGGSAKYESAKTWWTNWWNRQVSDANGTDGWTLMSDFLKVIVNTVDGYESTLGYEILSEPQVHSSDQWTKIGAFNNFVVNELRKFTDKTIAYSMNIPVDLKSPIGVNPENLALMAPENKTNVVFKISLYGLPTPDSYQGDRLAVFVETSRLAQVPLYIGEWNNVKREQTINEEGEVVFQINPQLSDIDQSEADLIVETFKDIDAWGMAYWQWRVGTHQVENYNLINVTLGTGEIETTKYFDILTNAYLQNFGNLSSISA
jgi:Cellulase (glycosyl hydrolase family 5)